MIQMHVADWNTCQELKTGKTDYSPRDFEKKRELVFGKLL